MFITKLNLTNFRNISSLTLSPGKGINFVTGHNGAGKTSVLEAIFALAQFKSFKVNNLNSIIADGQESTLVYAKVADENSNSHDLGLKITKKSKELFVNGEPAKKGVTSVTELLPVQVISPDVVELLTEGPEFRRKFIYWGAYYTYPNFFQEWKTFTVAHKNRNHLLKQAQAYRAKNQEVPTAIIEQCKVFGNVLAEVSERINQLNIEYVNNLLPVLQKVLADFLPELNIELKYYQGWPKDKSLKEYYAENLEREIETGRMSGGLSRADLRIKCFGENVVNILSRGQLKLLACALKIAQGDLLRMQTTSKCIYLIDDLAAELDEGKQIMFAKKLISENCQIFMTYIDNRILHIFSNLVDKWDEFSIAKGKLTHHYVNGEEVITKEFNLDDYI
ncbi:DNA replication/repair protein RecF [Psittacicella hinzii]|uniref:DNA replication and repair protein RecF n=1 Tax=Psittacicella hinzii TaxID=2028575 RepID=A0A3A1Y5B2_9GAMM|nr:DNA replication/repair protein RecF [Psittacicella hinzii]RIY32398.1 DNA replication/repair protein RecF [Psittacicella hinzii]